MAKDPRTKKRQPKSKAVEPPLSPERAAAKRKKLKLTAERQIDEFMKKVGCPDPSERTDENGWRWFEYQTARGRAGVVESESDGEMYLRAESLVGEIPADKDQALRFTRELLDANMTIPGAARIGISGESAFVCVTVPVVGLQADDVGAHIQSVMGIAASFVNPFAQPVKYEAPGQEEVPPAPVPDPNSQAA